LTSWIGNFKSILDLNLLTQLEYLSWIFWLDSNTWIKNSDSNWILTSWVLDLNLSTRLNVISLNKDESDSLIDFKNQSFKIKVLCWLDAVFKWCIITFLSFISFCRRVLIVFNVIWVVFNLMFILLTSFNIWIMSLWVDWSLSRVFISTFWLDSSTWVKHLDSIWILRLNISTRLDIDLESSQNSLTQLDSSSNWIWRQES